MESFLIQVTIFLTIFKKMLFSFSYYYSNLNEKEYSVGKLSAKYP